LALAINALAFRGVEDQLEWGRNSSPEGLNDGFTHCFIVSFAGSEGRDAYLPHPDHLAFCRRWLDPSLEKVCVVDFAANS
jgi:hypothetical protein